MSSTQKPPHAGTPSPTGPVATPATPQRTDFGRRGVEIPTAPPRRSASSPVETRETAAEALPPAKPAIPSAPTAPMPDVAPAASGTRTHQQPERRKLIVGRDIMLSGEINDCETLVIEGTLDAKLGDGQLLEITQAGLFRGQVEIENADIAGRFEGELTVRSRLLVRETGRVEGTIRYGKLEVQAGGQLIGDIAGAGAAPAPAIPEPVAVAPTTENVTEVTPPGMPERQSASATLDLADEFDDSPSSPEV